MVYSLYSIYFGMHFSSTMSFSYWNDIFIKFKKVNVDSILLSNILPILKFCCCHNIFYVNFSPAPRPNPRLHIAFSCLFNFLKSGTVLSLSFVLHDFDIFQNYRIFFFSRKCLNLRLSDVSSWLDLCIFGRNTALSNIMFFLVYHIRRYKTPWC